MVMNIGIPFPGLVAIVSFYGIVVELIAVLGHACCYGFREVVLGKIVHIVAMLLLCL